MPRLPKIIQSVDRAIAILDGLAKAGETGHSLKVISRDVGLNSSTAHHLLATLIAHQVVEQDRFTKHYRLGIHLLELGNSAKESTSLARVAIPYLERVWETTGQGTSLLVFHGLVRTPILGLNSQRMLTAQRAPLETSTLHATGSGKLLLAFLPETELDEYLDKARLERFTAFTKTHQDQLCQEFETIRRQGYSLDQEEYGKGVHCIAAPIQDASRRVAGCLDVVFPSCDVNADQITAWIELICQNAAGLSNQLLDIGLVIS